ncbi:hypothetical protein OKA04_10925 [Luteolibacter flavescens]|uniref:Lipoprotein n=1 Tax=Luteolibacter flavescens TaxID=1859460 RepID=A0ABT3FNV8_9BACT|nr:hypothetical protein [Luteolibacter flavescens]MCW1885242.1 hypothetical protein [Luteolibacter flavescens]
MKLVLAAALSVLVFASCVPSTPAARIAAQPGMYDRLPAKHQELVSRGELAKGMSTDAVYLAWGRASREYEGSENGASTLRWDYAGSTPVYSNSFYSGWGYGMGYGRYGRYGYPYSTYGLGQEITYVPYRRASVLFSNGRVKSWERSRTNY